MQKPLLIGFICCYLYRIFSIRMPSIFLWSILVLKINTIFSLLLIILDIKQLITLIFMQLFPYLPQKSKSSPSIAIYESLCTWSRSSIVFQLIPHCSCFSLLLILPDNIVPVSAAGLAGDLSAGPAAAAHSPDPDPGQTEDEALSVQSSLPLLKHGYVEFVWLENIDSHQVQILNQIFLASSHCDI